MIDLRIGDANKLIREIPDNSLHSCISSPPYYQLRDYGTAAWDGGDPACDHVVQRYRIGDGLADFSSELKGGGERAQATPAMQAPDICPKCSAKRIDAQMGLEASPDAYIASMVALYREIRRALRPDGTCWINIGDSYSSMGGDHSVQEVNQAGVGGARAHHGGAGDKGQRRPPDGIKAKDMIGIPWMLAFALRADGWYLRQEIIWHKPNPMPESVKDRATKAHESFFLLSKSPIYYFDQEAWAEARVGDEDANGFRGGSYCHDALDNDSLGKREAVGNKRHRQPAGWQQGPGAHDPFHPDGRARDVVMVDDNQLRRNKRSVWTIASRALDLEMCRSCSAIYGKGEYRALARINIGADDAPKWRRQCRCGANDDWLSHFATYPPDLIEPAILAGCPKDGTILDPFGGAGTTGLVADRLQRNSILFELNPAYAAMARYRIDQDRGGLLGLMEQGHE